VTIFDVAVIGAGPAGAVAACLLARAGRSVLLVDPLLSGARPAKPGDALPGAALRILRACDLPLPSQSASHRPIGGNVSAWGTPNAVYRDFFAEPDGPAWRLDRSVFEADLLAAARAAGADPCAAAFGKAVREGGLWRVDLRGAGRVDTRWLIDATGRAATVARKLGAYRRRDEPLVAVIGYGQPDDRARLDRSMVETTPDGWWYAALLPDRRPVFMLHTRPRAAVRFLAAPAAWRAALAETRHITAAFPAQVVDGPLRGYEACGAWLEPFWGDGWAACGDAALSFEPCAAQGLLSALYGGMEVGRGITAALRGDMDGLHRYAAQSADIRRIYRYRIRAHCADERRWPESGFWQAARAMGEIDAMAFPSEDRGR
jgi:2-polyprenyl-6-methoxyphenol hydroxylase-like FAD-dependent oxidoreductase